MKLETLGRHSKNIAVLVSGNGSNLQSIIDKIESGYLNVNLAVVISNKDGVKALEKARNHNIPTFFISHRELERVEHERKIIEILKKYNVELVVLAGYMRIITSFFINQYPDRIINIHPSLLPSFPGVDGYGDALKYGVKITGCTVHFVNEGMDTGKIILQRAIEVLENDTVDTLRERGLEVEHEALPDAIKLWSEGKIRN